MAHEKNPLSSLHERASFNKAMVAAREPRLHGYAALVAMAAAGFGLPLGLRLGDALARPFSNPHEIVGWVSVNQHAIQNEYLLFAAALLYIPLTILVGWGLWLISATAVAGGNSDALPQALKRCALAAALLLVAGAVVSGYYLVAIIAGGGLLLAEFGSTQKPPSQAPPPGQGRGWILLQWVGAPLLIYVLVYNGSVDGGIDLFHEGEFLAPLAELNRGGRVYTDIYVQHGPGFNVGLPWLAAKLFGPSLESVRALENLLEPLRYVALYFLGLQIFRGRWLTALLLIFIATGENTQVYHRQTQFILAIAFAAGYLGRSHLDASGNQLRRQLRDCALLSGLRARLGGGRRPRLWRVVLTFALGWQLLIAGLLAAGAFWYSTDIGVYTIVALTAFLCIYALRPTSKRRRLLPLLVFGAGAAVGTLPLLWLAARGGLGAFVGNTYKQVSYQSGTWGLPYPKPSTFFELLTPSQLSELHVSILEGGLHWYFAVVIFLLTAGYLTWRALCQRFWASPGCARTLLLLIAGALLYRSALGRSDSYHVVFGSTLVWPLCLLLVDHGVARLIAVLRAPERDRRQLLASAAIILPLLFFVYFAHHQYHPARSLVARVKRLTTTPFSPARAEREPFAGAGRIRVPEIQQQRIQAIVLYIQKETGTDETLYDFSSQGGYYFFADRRSATRYHQTIYAATPAMQREIIADLEREQTKLVIFKTGGLFDKLDGIPSTRRHPLIADYLDANYEPATTIDRTMILKRKAP